MAVDDFTWLSGDEFASLFFSTISYDLPEEEGHKRYNKLFVGSILGQMPKLLADNREPMAADFFQRRIDVFIRYQKALHEGASPSELNVLKAKVHAWWGQYADLAVLWLRHPDKGGKIVPYDGKNGKVMEVLRQMTPEAKLIDDALPLSDGFYESFDGKDVLELKPSEIKELQGKFYKENNILPADSWVTLIGGNERVEQYLEVCKQVTRSACLFQSFGDASEGVVTARLWSVGSGAEYSHMKSTYKLTNPNSCLFGVDKKPVVCASLDNILALKAHFPNATDEEQRAFEEVARSYCTRK